MQNNRLRVAPLALAVLFLLVFASAGCGPECPPVAPAEIVTDGDIEPPGPPMIIIEPKDEESATTSQNVKWTIKDGPAKSGAISAGKINKEMFGDVVMTANTKKGDKLEIEHAVLRLASGEVLIIRRFAPSPHSKPNKNWIEWRLDKKPLGRRSEASVYILPSDILGPVMSGADGPEMWVTLADTGETLRATRIAINE